MAISWYSCARPGVLLQSQPKFRHGARHGSGGVVCDSSGGSTCSVRARQSFRRMPIICHASLPHMDEEIEHMQWQLGKRSLDSSNETKHASSHKHSTGNRHRNQGKASSTSSSAGGKSRPLQHVFHERHSSRRCHLHHHHRHSRHNGSTGDSSSSGLEDIHINQDETFIVSEHDGATAVASPAADVPDLLQATAQQQQDQQRQHTLLQQQQSHHTQQQQQQPTHYHMQLLPRTAASDLQKFKERLFKHIQQDGGCYVSAAAAQSSALTHLLLGLQQKLVQEQPASLLLLQPVQATVAAAAGGSVGQQRHANWSNAGVAIGGEQQHDLSNEIDYLSFWATLVPLEVLLGLVQQQGTAATAVGNSTISSCSTTASATSMSLLDGSFSLSMESSSEDWQASSSSTTTTALFGAAAGDAVTESTAAAAAAAATTVGPSSSTHGMDMHSRKGSSSSSSSAEDALLYAAASGCSATGALLLQARSRNHLKCVQVGSRAEVLAVALSVLRAVTAERVESLHVKGHAGAHAIAYTALEMAAAKLQAGPNPNKGFGVLMVPGEVHEHIHAVRQGHATAAAAAAAFDNAGGEHHHAGKGTADASMAVSGIGAAFYGIGDNSSSSGGSGRVGEHGLLHKHAQEMWLCVVPL